MDDAKLNDDAPITEPGQDRLGFGELARHLADALRSGGLVVGIEGKWGSGKSSLANLALKALETESQEPRPRIVRFSPWIVGNRNELLRQLFSELGAVLPEYRDTRALLNRYAQSAPILAAASELGAPAAGIPSGGLSRILHWTGKLASKAATPSLSRQRNELREIFRTHKISVVIFVDDIDRLEPAEAVEILRLVRAVADFPNVGYLLAYDPSVLAKSLENALHIEKGKEYVEKIVQASFTIPDPLSFYLRSWLSEEMEILAKHAIIAESAKSRLDKAIRTWCMEYISTPRDVVRLINSLKLFVIPIIEKIDLADALFIQIIRIHHSNLYYWIERYTKSYFAFHSELHGAEIKRIGIDSSGNATKEFIDIIDKDDDNKARFVIDMREHLPEISMPDFPRTQYLRQTIEKWAEERRLWSASYFRLYFALSMLPESISDEELVYFLNQCVDEPKEAARRFGKLCGTVRRQGGNMAEMLLFRIVERGVSMSPSQMRGLFTVLGEVADVFIRNFRSPFGSTVRLHGELIAIFHLVKRLPHTDRAAILEDVFENAASLAWLSGIVWEAAGEHGLTHDMPKLVEQRLLTPEEFDSIRTRFLKRLKRAAPDRLKEVPLFPGLMEVWCVAGGREDAKAWVATQAAHDEGFIDLLERLSFGHYVQMPDDYRHAPRRGMLEILFESVEQVEGRLNAIASRTGVTADLREDAKRLVSAIAAKQQTDKETG